MDRDKENIATCTAVLTLILIGFAFGTVRGMPAVQEEFARITIGCDRFFSAWQTEPEFSTEGPYPKRRMDARWDAIPMEGMHQSKSTSSGKESSTPWVGGFVLVAVTCCFFLSTHLYLFFRGMGFGRRYIDGDKVYGVANDGSR